MGAIGQKENALRLALKLKNYLGFNTPAYRSFSISAYVRYRYDLDNSIIAIKFGNYALKTVWIIDDSPKYFRQYYYGLRNHYQRTRRKL